MTSDYRYLAYETYHVKRCPLWLLAGIMVTLVGGRFRMGATCADMNFDFAHAMQGVRHLDAAAANRRPISKNTIGMEMVLIPAGKFRMGTLRTEYVGNDDERAVDVTLTRAFYLGRTEVTQSQWQAVMKTTPWKGRPLTREGDDYPATYIRWNDAHEFCSKLGAKEQRQYRLPTEAEWEYACRAGTTTLFSFGDDEASLGTYAWFKENAWDANERYPHRVAQKRPNAFGLYDMHGNVWEWCEDVYHWELPGGKDPLVTVGNTARVDRGGGWASDGREFCRSAARFSNVPWRGDKVLGFRVALTPEPKKDASRKDATAGTKTRPPVSRPK